MSANAKVILRYADPLLVFYAVIDDLYCVDKVTDKSDEFEKYCMEQIAGFYKVFSIDLRVTTAFKTVNPSDGIVCLKEFTKFAEMSVADFLKLDLENLSNFYAALRAFWAVDANKEILQRLCSLIYSLVATRNSEWAKSFARTSTTVNWPREWSNIDVIFDDDTKTVAIEQKIAGGDYDKEPGTVPDSKAQPDVGDDPSGPPPMGAPVTKAEGTGKTGKKKKSKKHSK